MKTSTTGKSRLLSLTTILLPSLVKAWLVGILAIVIVTCCTVGSVYYCIRYLKAVAPQTQLSGQNTNTVKVVWGSSINYTAPNIPTNYPQPPTQNMPPLTQEAMTGTANTFSFQYFFCSTNSSKPVWVSPGTNLTVTTFWPWDDPRAIANPFWLSTNVFSTSPVFTNADNSNCFDFVYQVDGLLYRYCVTNINGTPTIVTNAPLSLVVSVTTNLQTWQPLYTNQAVGLDMPYIFTDNNAVSPKAFYRVNTQ